MTITPEQVDSLTNLLMDFHRNQLGYDLEDEVGTTSIGGVVRTWAEYDDDTYAAAQITAALFLAEEGNQVSRRLNVLAETMEEDAHRYF